MKACVEAGLDEGGLDLIPMPSVVERQAGELRAVVDSEHRFQVALCY